MLDSAGSDLEFRLNAIESLIKANEYDRAQTILHDTIEIQKRIQTTPVFENLQIKNHTAQIFDHKKQFVRAALWYYSLSESYDTQNKLIMLNNAIKCAILSPFGVDRSKMIYDLFQNEKSKQTPCFFMLKYFFQKSIIYLSSVKKFEAQLEPHQLLAETKHGEQLLRHNIIEHNILSSIRTNPEFTFKDMSRSFEVPVTELRTIATRMINEGILNGEIKSDTLYFSEEDSGYVIAQEVYVEMFNTSRTYRSSNSSTSSSLQSTDSAQYRFRKQLIKLTHQNKNMNMLKCEISQNKYPAKYVVAGHIIKKSFGNTKLRSLLNLSDINDPGNGILMFVSIEYHFDRGNLCLVKNNGSDDFYRVKILHKDLECISIIEEGVRVCGVNSSIDFGDQTISTIFRDLQTVDVRLDNRCERFIRFHSSMAMKQDHSLDVTFGGLVDRYYGSFVESCSPKEKQMNYAEKVRQWFDLNDLQTHSSSATDIKCAVQNKDLLQLKSFGTKEILLATGANKKRVQRIIKKLHRICQLKTLSDINHDQKVLVGKEEYYWLELAGCFTTHNEADSNE